MSVNIEFYKEITTYLSLNKVQLIAVSKTKPNEAILDLHQLGHKDFGENYVQELVDKAAALPQDIHWHFIGHLQSNKVKYIAPFVYLIHGVDSEKLLIEINKQALKKNRIINCLLQLKIAKEETKFGMSFNDVEQLLNSEEFQSLKNINILGFMGMATFTDDEKIVRAEFKTLKKYFETSKKYNTLNFDPTVLSMGMSDDYKIAIEEGSTMIRVGSAIFGQRNYN